jgi:hypothetical protein
VEKTFELDEVGGNIVHSIYTTVGIKSISNALPAFDQYGDTKAEQTNRPALPLHGRARYQEQGKSGQDLLIPRDSGPNV